MSLNVLYLKALYFLGLTQFMNSPHVSQVSVKLRLKKPQ